MTVIEIVHTHPFAAGIAVVDAERRGDEPAARILVEHDPPTAAGEILAAQLMLPGLRNFENCGSFEAI